MAIDAEILSGGTQPIGDPTSGATNQTPVGPTSVSSLLSSYPTNAPRGGSKQLVGSGSASDVFPFAHPAVATVVNGTNATIYITFDNAPATQADRPLAAGQVATSPDLVNGVGVYGVAATPVNSGSGGIYIAGSEQMPTPQAP